MLRKVTKWLRKNWMPFVAGIVIPLIALVWHHESKSARLTVDTQIVGSHPDGSGNSQVATGPSIQINNGSGTVNVGQGSQPIAAQPATKTEPKVQPKKRPAHSNGNTAIGPVTQGQGSALSVNQRGGITAGSVTMMQPKQPCHSENGGLLDCSHSEVVDWCQPVTERLDAEIQKYDEERRWKVQLYQMNHNQALLTDGTTENADLNRYLERDYQNFVICRAALVSAVRGGDPLISSDPVKDLGMASQFYRYMGFQHIGFSDQFSMLGAAQLVLDDLRTLSALLAAQVQQESHTQAGAF